MVLTHVMNTVTSAVTTFDNFDFNSFVEIDGKYYGANATGLHQIDIGLLDDTSSIAWMFATGDIDFGLSVLKRVEDFYIAMRSEWDVTLNVYVDEVLIGTYVLSPNDIETLKQVRSLIGKGARGRYWRFELSGDSSFDFDAYNILVVPVTRRV